MRNDRRRRLGSSYSAQQKAPTLTRFAPLFAIDAWKMERNSAVTKPELGTKRVCPDSGRKFYDLNKDPVISPYTGKVVPIEVATAPARANQSAAARRATAPAEEAAVPAPQETEFVSLEDAEAEQQGAKGAVETTEPDVEEDV